MEFFEMMRRCTDGYKFAPKGCQLAAETGRLFYYYSGNGAL
jgi:hypothetical protein